nr:MAG TPA: hypothetical protein [Caudoviricetes sp.]
MSRAHLFLFFENFFLTRAGKCDTIETNKETPPLCGCIIGEY